MRAISLDAMERVCPPHRVLMHSTKAACPRLERVSWSLLAAAFRCNGTIQRLGSYDARLGRLIYMLEYQRASLEIIIHLTCSALHLNVKQTHQLTSCIS